MAPLAQVDDREAIADVRFTVYEWLNRVADRLVPLRELERILEAELDTSPSESTSELAREIDRRRVESLQNDADLHPDVITLLGLRVDGEPDTPLSPFDHAQNAKQAVCDLLHDLEDGKSISDSRDAIVLGFSRPSSSVRFAMGDISRCREVERHGPVPIGIGIHLGEGVATRPSVTER
jgi:hypothetical protein